LDVFSERRRVLSLLTCLLLALHLMCVNLASAGPLCAVWLDWRESRGDAAAGVIGRWLVGSAVLALLLGGLLGLAVGATLWEPAFQNALSAVQRRIYFGLWELLFSLVLMLMQYAWWKASKRTSMIRVLGRGFLALLAASNLLYHFPLLFSVIRQLTQNGAPESPLSSAEFRSAMMESPNMSLAMHFLLASLAVCGVAVMLRCAFFSGDPATEQAADNRRMMTWGGRLALTPTVLQLPVGLWLLFQFPQPVQNQLIGGNLVAAGLFGAAVLTALGLMHQLASVAMGEPTRRSTIVSAGMMALVIVLMTGVLRAVS